jgi:GDSL-like Lipase/Acylhydrolase family
MMNRRTAGLVVVALLLSAAPAWALKRFMLMGDSIQAGTGVTNASSLTANLLSTTANVVVENFSSPGARMTDVGFFRGMTHDGMCVQQVHGFFGMQGLIITLGTNDWAGGVDGTTFLNAYLALIDSIPAGIPVICVTPIWRSDEATLNPTSGLVLNGIRFVAAAACALRGFQFIDGSALIPHDRLYYSEPATSVALHPNDLGHMLMAANLRAQLTAIGWLP